MRFALLPFYVWCVSDFLPVSLPGTYQNLIASVHFVRICPCPQTITNGNHIEFSLPSKEGNIFTFTRILNEMNYLLLSLPLPPYLSPSFLPALPPSLSLSFAYSLDLYFRLLC